MAAITTEGANMMEGTKLAEAAAQSKMGPGSARKKNRSRSASASSVDSVSSGSYTGECRRGAETTILTLLFRFQLGGR